MLFIHRTQKGKVVYERPKHLFDERDVERVARSVFLRQHADAGILGEILYRLSTYFLRIILDVFGLGVFTGVVYDWLVKMVGYVLTLLEGAADPLSAAGLVDQLIVMLADKSDTYGLVLKPTNV